MKNFKLIFEDKRTKVTQITFEKHNSKKELIRETKAIMKTVFRHPLRLKSVQEI